MNTHQQNGDLFFITCFHNGKKGIPHNEVTFSIS
jgi:hypothetical protein